MQHLGERMLDACASIGKLLKPGGFFMSLEPLSGSFYSSDVQLTTMYDQVMPSRRTGMPAVQMAFSLPALGFTIASNTPVCFLRSGAQVAEQDPGWLKMAGMGRMLVSRNVLSQEAADDFMARYKRAAADEQMMVVSVVAILVACKK